MVDHTKAIMQLCVTTFLITVFALTACTLPVKSSRILAIETVAGKSHWNFMNAVLGALLDGGHSVTVFTPFPGGQRENYTEVDMSGSFTLRVAMSVEHVAKMFDSQWKTLSFLMAMVRQDCRNISTKPGGWTSICRMACTPISTRFSSSTAWRTA